MDHFSTDILNITIRPNFKVNVQHFMAKTIIITSNTTTENETDSILEIFSDFGFLNIAFIRESADGNILVKINASLVNQESTKFVSPNVSILFPDKLKNMQGFTYKIAIYRQKPRIYVVNGTVVTPLAYFMAAVAEVQNATVEYMIESDFRGVLHHWMHRTMHLSLNSALNMRIREPELLTYEENGYCALVPLPTKTTLLRTIIIEPFDFLTWMFLLLSIVCSVLVWWMFRGRGAVDSPLFLVYGIFVMFIGQGVEFSRKNRLALTIMLQLIIVMIWILNNAYEGVITSFMIEPIQENRFESFDDLVASDYVMIADDAFNVGISGSESYKTWKKRLNTSGPNIGNRFPLELTRGEFVFILTCEQNEVIIRVTLPKVNRKVSEFYYMLPQKILPFMMYIPASYLNPFLDRFQYYMDLCFQAGLMHMWKVFVAEIDPFKQFVITHDMEKAYLELKDLRYVFAILAIGYGISAVVLLIEIFFHDILRELKLASQARKLKNRIHQMAYKKRRQRKHPRYQKGALYYIIHRRKRVKRLKPRKLKVRRIYVQPRFPMD